MRKIDESAAWEGKGNFRHLEIMDDRPSPDRIVEALELVRAEEAMKKHGEFLEALKRKGVSPKYIEDAEAKQDRLVTQWLEASGAAEGGRGIMDAAMMLSSSHGGYLSLAEVATLDLRTGEQATLEQQESRQESWRHLMWFILQESSKAVRAGKKVTMHELWLAFKNFLAMVRREFPDILGGATMSDLAELFGETRQAQSRREAVLYELLQSRSGAKGASRSGGRGEEVKQKSRRRAVNNKSRKTGILRRRLLEEAQQTAAV